MSALNVQVEELSPVVRRVQVDVPAERVGQVTDLVYRRLGQNVRLKGYRQGHVPRRVLERHFASQVKTDVARTVVETTLPEALDQVKLQPVGSPTFEPEELRLGEAFRYRARIEVMPEVTLAGYKGLEVSVPEQKIDDAQVDAQIEQMRQSLSTLAPIEDRDDAQTGDFANVAYELTFPGQERAPYSTDDAQLRIEPGLFLHGAAEKLTGAKIGETREFTETMPEGEDGGELAGQQVHVKATLKGLKRRELPALDDEFARDAGQGVDSLDALRQKLRQQLEAEAAQRLGEARRDALTRALIERNPIEVPPALVDNRADMLARQFAFMLSRQGLRLPNMDMFVDEYKHSVMDRAQEDVKSYLLLDAVAKAESIEVSAEEVQAKVEEFAAEEGASVGQFLARYGRSALDQIATQLRRDRAFALVEESATVTLTPAAEPSAEADSAGTSA